MPVDERLRAGFRRNASAVPSDVDRAFASTVVTGRRRGRVRRIGRSIAVVASLLVLAVLAPRIVSSLRQPDTSVPGGKLGILPSPPYDPLGGAWHVWYTCSDRDAALKGSGLTRAARQLHFRCSGPSSGTVVFQEGVLEAFGHQGGLGWRGPYRVVDASTFVAGHESFGGTLYLRYGFVIRGDTLTVAIEKDAYPIVGRGRNGRRGDLVAQTIAWSSAPFHHSG